MRDFDLLLPRIMPRAVGCPEPTALAAVRDAVAELCERTKCWVVSSEFTLTAPGDEMIVAPRGAMIHEIDSVKHCGERLSPITITDLDDRIHDWERRTDGAPRFYTQMGLNSIRVVPNDAGQAFRVRVFLKPSESATSAPDDFMDQHREVIADLALARILTTPAQSWSNPDLAGYHAMKGGNRLDELAYTYRQGQQSAPLRTRPSFI